MAITTIKEAYENIWEFRGLSTDKKPTDTTNSSVFLEIDTGALYIFDAENKEWKPIGSGGGQPGPTPGGNYSAGPGLKLIGTEFSIDEQIVAKKQEVDVELKKKQDALTAGEGIEISPNPSTGKLVINATGGGNISKGSGEKSLLQTPRYETFTGLDGETYPVDAAGQASVVFGGKGYADPNSKYAFVMGTGNVTKTGCTTVIGDNCLVDNFEENGSIVESFGTFVTGYANHVTGSAYSIVGGKENIVYDAVQSFVVGSSNEAYGHNIFVEGHENFNGDLSHASIEGTHGEGSHVAGIGNRNDSFYSFITGVRNENVAGDYSFVTGLENKVDDSKYSFVAGIRNTSHNAQGQTVFGQYNNNRYDSLFEIGCGENDSLRKNAFRIDKTGKVYFYNDSYYIDNVGYFNGTCRAASSANYASTADAANTANRASFADNAEHSSTTDRANWSQDAFHADKVTIAADGSYAGAILINSNNDPNTIVRRDNVTITSDGKIKVFTDTTNSDTWNTLATKSYVDSHGGGTYYEGYGITIDSSNYININTNITATRDWVNYWMSEYYTSKSSFNTLQDRVTSAEGSISTVSSRVNVIENNIFDHSRTISGTFNTYAEIAAAANARTLTTNAYYVVLIDETHNNETSVYVYVMHAAIYSGPYLKVLTEAPNDGKKYARQGGTRSWVEIPVYTAGDHIDIDSTGKINVIDVPYYTNGNGIIFSDVSEGIKAISIDTSLLDEKANVADVYTKTQTYSKTEVDNGLNSKIDKYYGQGSDLVYGVNTSGEQQHFVLSTNASSFAIARRDSGGRLKVGTPSDDNDAVNLEYFDATMSTMATKTYVDNAVASVLKTITLTQAEFDALTEYEDNTNYQII